MSAPTQLISNEMIRVLVLGSVTLRLRVKRLPMKGFDVNAVSRSMTVSLLGSASMVLQSARRISSISL